MPSSKIDMKLRPFKFTLFILSLCFISLFISCDDGDIFITEFDLSDETLEFCDVGDNSIVLFKIKDETNESIAFTFVKPEGFDTNQLPESNDAPITIALNDENRLIYRKFDRSITRDYYCGTIPPSGINVTEEFLSTSGGQAIIGTEIITRDDGDGISAEDEGFNPDSEEDSLDTDNDGIPDYYDRDDDGDNVLTTAELDRVDGEIVFLDTDGDGIPNYLDNDDDNDGILTINENQELVDNEELRDYLNPEVSENSNPDTKKNVLKHSATFETVIRFEDITMVGLEQTIVDESLQVLGSLSNTREIDNPTE